MQRANLERAAIFAGAFQKIARFLFFAGVLWADSLIPAHGQSALDGFDPNANGVVRTFAVQADGKILIGGEFTTISPNGGAPVTRNRMARLNPDGTLDTGFDPNANNWVRVVVVQPNGKILIGGDFTTVSPNGGAAVTCNRIARLNSDGTLDTAFNPNANAAVAAIVVEADDRILLGGDFTTLSPNGGGAVSRNRIARVNADGTLDTAFDPNANGGAIRAIAVQADGRILVGGAFNGANGIGGATRNYIARLEATTGAADSFDPNANGPVISIAVQPDGRILAGGLFSGANSIGGATRNRIARLDPATGLADSFDPNADAFIIKIAVQADGRILAGGIFTSMGGQTRSNLARLNPDGTLDTAFNPNANSDVYAIAVQGDGKILAGGFFTSIGGQPRNRIARLETDGRLDRTLDVNTVGLVVYATAVQPDGKILMGGDFSSVLGVARTNIARLNSDGTLDTAFNPNANGAVLSIAVQSGGRILAGGIFTSIGGQPRNRIARLDATNGAPDSFNPNANNTIYSIAVQADGRILACGDFTNIGGAPRNRLARLDATGGSADPFNPDANNTVVSIALQPDGKILAGGDFTSIGGQTRNRIARLEETIGSADSFNPNATNTVLSMLVQPDGKILVGGSFSGANSIGGATRNRIARLDPTSGMADSFDPNASLFVLSFAVQADGKILTCGSFTNIGGAARTFMARLEPTTGLADSFNADPTNNPVRSLALQADGKILAGGQFFKIGGQMRSRFARLNNDIVARQNLAATPTTITWALAGSSPQFTRVTFESSTDSVNYTPLGNGTVTGSNWTLTGLSLSTGMNLYIRARGYYRSGDFNGSESLTESVRNVFLAPQPILNIQRSANTNVVLSWATNFTGFKLESNTNLNTNVWSVVTNAPAVTGTNNIVTNAASDAARFYRLRK
jgi:uncharacterized delta-60 repeat protein